VGSYSRIDRRCGSDALEQGLYAVQIGAFDPNSTSYDVTLNCTPCLTPNPTPTPTPKPGAACDDVTLIPPGGGTFIGTTAGPSTLGGTCAPAAGPERVFQWTPDQGGIWTIQTCGSGTNFDTVLYLREGDCTEGMEVDCNDQHCTNALGFGENASLITPVVNAGETYFIVVDGYGDDFFADEGEFTLNVAPGTLAQTTGRSAQGAGGPISGMNAAVRISSSTSCPTFDGDGSGSVTIDDPILAVSDSPNQCNASEQLGSPRGFAYNAFPPRTLQGSGSHD
jgi:hypothetical protein